MDGMSGLYPINQIGSDGFSWWIGQIESEKKDDEKGSGRYKVRIVGVHPKECDIVSWNDLPWAMVMMPVTNPHTPGGATSVSDQLGLGVWVVGFYLDADKQQPIIMGSVGRTANSTSEATPTEPNPGENCKSFTTYIAEENKIPFDQDAGETVEQPPTDSGHPVPSTPLETEEGSIISSGVTNFLKAKYSENTSTNPAGKNWCVEVADKCGKETDLKNTFTRLFSEMLAETQRNDGKLGTYLVGELSGELYDSIGIGRKYVDKGILVTRTFVASVKGFVLEKIKAGIKDLINFLLYPSDEGNSLSAVTTFFNEQLAKVGCQMADLGDRLAAFLEDLMFGYLFEVYKSAACLVDNFVEGLLSKFQSMMEELLETVLGPLQDLLGAAASAINIIGDAINYVLDLLGIQCNGPGKSCSKTTKVCTNCETDKRDDFLDELLKNITDDLFPVTGEDWSRYTCDDAYTGNTIKDTNVVFVGGVQTPPVPRSIQYDISDIRVEEGSIATFIVTRVGAIDVSSSVSYATRNGSATESTDYVKTNGILGFAPGETSKEIEVRTLTDDESEPDEEFFMTIKKDSPGTIPSFAKRSVAKCVITESTVRTPGVPQQPTGDDTIPTPTPPGTPTENPTTFIPDIVKERDTASDTTVVTDDPTYKVVADKSSVKEGEFVTFTVTTTNVPNGTTLFYRMFGIGITPQDIVNSTLSGSFVIEDNTANVVVGIAKDNVIEDDEVLTFAIGGTSANTSVLIVSDTAGFSAEELSDVDDSSSNTEPRSNLTPKSPTVGSVITTPSGGIIDVQISDPGDPYTEPPVVILPGQGFRATAIPLLDSTGRLTEIRVTDPGFGYKLNTPQKSDKECIIDSFTMLSPGREYTSPPEVYINGDNTVADAVVENGKVISVRIKNRSLVFDTYPKVLIIGGGGYGARFIPSFACLDRDARVTVGSAKIGTGRYVDCP